MYIQNNNSNKLVIIGGVNFMTGALVVDEHNIECWSQERLPDYLVPVSSSLGTCLPEQYIAAAVYDKSKGQYMTLDGDEIGDREDFEVWSMKRLNKACQT